MLKICHFFPVNPLVISYNGASGNYPGSTDLAYNNAILDGADILDCSVQMTKDGVPICLGSINLINSTTVAQTEFNSFLKSVPELGGNGIYTFDLGWTDIQGLTRKFSTAQKQFLENTILSCYTLTSIFCFR